MEEVGVEPSGLSSCPSFNTYSSDRLAYEVEEGLNHHHHQDTEEEHHDDDFEFFPVAENVPNEGFVISSDQIGPVFPVFNRNLLLVNGYGINGHNLRSSEGGGVGEVQSIRIPLMDLFMEEDHDLMSSEADNELQGIPEGSYCVWTPRDSVQSSSSWCKKSNSTGSRSSRRWRFLDLLWRSNSDRKESFVFLTPSSNREAKLVEETRNNIMSRVRISGSSESSGGNNGKLTAGVAAEEGRKGKSALELFYTRSQVVVRRGGNRRKSYLPYRQDLVGFFANVNRLGRTIPPVARPSSPFS